MFLCYRFSLKNYPSNIFFGIIFLLHLKCYFCTLYTNVDLYDSKSSSITEEERIRRRNVIEPISRFQHNVKKDWLETYHEIFPEQLALPQVERSSQDSCTSDSGKPTLSNMEFSLQKTSQKCRNVDEMQDFSSKIQSNKNPNSWSETKKLKNIKWKDNKKMNLHDQNYRLNVYNSFKPLIPDLERGEYIPPES